MSGKPRGIFLDIANQHAPLRHKRFKSEYIPQMTEDIKRQYHHRDYLKKKAAMSNSS